MAIGSATVRAVIERDNSDAIARTQRFDKTVRGRANQSHVIARRSGRVEQQRDLERRFGGAEVGDGLRLTVFDEAEVFRFQSGERAARAVSHDCRNRDELRIDPDDVAFVNFFGAAVVFLASVVCSFPLTRRGRCAGCWTVSDLLSRDEQRDTTMQGKRREVL